MTDRSPTWPSPTELSPAVLTGLTSYTVSDNDNQLHIVVPQFSGHEPLSRLLRTTADEQAKEYLEEYALDPGAEAVAPPWTSGTWTATAASSSIIGVVLTRLHSPGASTGTSRIGIWYDLEAGRVLSGKDLLTDSAQDEIADRALSALEQAGAEPDAEMLRRIVAEDAALLAFTSAGELLLGFDSHTVVAGALGAPAVTFPDPAALGWLTDHGRAAQDASVAPVPSAVPTTAPRPTGETEDGEHELSVALTFDDGPSPDTTPRLLEILAEHGVPATFFVLGSQAQAFPEIVSREIDDGHEVANHSWTHPDLSAMSEDAVRDEVGRTNTALVELTGAAPRLLRPPYGATGPAVKAVAEELDMAQVMWDVDTRDWEHHDPAKTVAAIEDATAGSIVLMHDIHASTVDAVEEVISRLREKGFSFATVTSLLGSPAAGTVHRRAD